MHEDGSADRLHVLGCAPPFSIVTGLLNALLRRDLELILTMKALASAGMRAPVPHHGPAETLPLFIVSCDLVRRLITHLSTIPIPV